MKISFRISKKVVCTILAGVALFAILVTVLLLISKWENREDDQQDAPVSSRDSRSEIYVGGKRYALKENIESVLFIGIDKYEDEAQSSYLNNQQADVLLLLIVDHDAQEYSVLQINRDTMTQIRTLGVTGGTGGAITAQLALAHSYGTGGIDSADNTAYAVSKLLYGVDITHYASLKLDGISILNDAVGGVEIELMDDFTMLDDSFEKGATVTLHGEEATAYVRYRGELEDATNIHRMDRQRQYISAWLDKWEIVSAGDDQFVAETALSISDYLISDMTVNAMVALEKSFEEYASNGILTIAGESVKGETYMEFYVDEEALQQQVLELFYTPVE